MTKLRDDTTRIDEAALGLLYLTLHDDNRAWKGLDWGIFARLHAAGLIHNPVGKTKSLGLHPGRPRRRRGRVAEIVHGRKVVTIKCPITATLEHY
jgi:hypothetical protein